MRFYVRTIAVAVCIAVSLPVALNSSLTAAESTANSVGSFDASIGLFAATAAPVVRVEEDWELVIGAPDVPGESPQIRCVMSPSRDLDAAHMAFTLNHRTQPVYQAGGVQLQAWNGDEPEMAMAVLANVLLSHDGDVVQWTQIMSVADGKLTFEIDRGSSTSWKKFGGNGHLRVSIATIRTDLNAYHPRMSEKNSGVGFGANRVRTLVLREVRSYSADGLLWRGAVPGSSSNISGR